MQELDLAYKQLKQALKNLDKAEDKAIEKRQFELTDQLEKLSSDIAGICDQVRTINMYEIPLTNIKHE